MRLPTDNSRTAFWIALACLPACVLYAVLPIVSPQLFGVALRFTPDRTALVWPRPVLSCLTAGCGILLGALAPLIVGRGARNRETRQERLLHALLPLGFLPLACLPLFLRHGPADAISSNIFFFAPPLLAALVICRALDARSLPVKRRTVPATVTLLLVLSTLVFSATGWWFTTAIGPHSGDEGHYLVQAESLYHDHDLDLRNDLEPIAHSKSYYHISPASEGEHWYSYHPFGLSLLLAPLVPAGPLARHLVLGLIAGLGLAGMFLLCLRFRADPADSLLIVALFGLGAFWGVYSSRCLPEVLGASLTVWLAVAIIDARTKPAPTMLLAAVTAGFLPWAHTRFIPLSLLGTGLMGLQLLTRDTSWKQRILSAASFAALMGIVYLPYYAVHRMMFEGVSSYPVSKLLMANPLGMWRVLAGPRSILFSLPMFAWMLAATVRTAISDRDNRIPAAGVMLAFLVVLVTSCSGQNWIGGTTLPGRFLLVVAPLMIAPTARVLGLAGKPARTWLLFLALLACAWFTLMLTHLPQVGRSFINPTYSLPRVLPLLSGLVNPFSGVGPGVLFPPAILSMVVTAGIVFMPDRCRPVQVVVLSLLLIALFGSHAPARAWAARLNVDRSATAEILALTRLTTARVRSWGDSSPVPILSVSDRFGPASNKFGPQSITTEDLGTLLSGTTVSQPRIPLVDWDGRRFRWTTLLYPFKATRDRQVLRLRGTLSGDCVPVLVIRKGERDILERELAADSEGRIDSVLAFRADAEGDLYVLLRLRGEGRFRVQEINWSPFSEELLRKAHLQLPPNVEHLD